MGIAQKHLCINARIWWPTFFFPICYSWYFGTVVMVGSWPRKVLLTFAFVAKTYALLWATLLFMHCSCMLKEERSIHIIILIFFSHSKEKLVSFAIFTKFADFTKAFLTFSLSKCRILFNLLFLLFLPYLLLNLFT